LVCRPSGVLRPLLRQPVRRACTCRRESLLLHGETPSSPPKSSVYSPKGPKHHQATSAFALRPQTAYAAATEKSRRMRLASVLLRRSLGARAGILLCPQPGRNAGRALAASKIFGDTCRFLDEAARRGGPSCGAFRRVTASDMPTTSPPHESAGYVFGRTTAFWGSVFCHDERDRSADRRTLSALWEAARERFSTPSKASWLPKSPKAYLGFIDESIRAMPTIRCRIEVRLFGRTRERVRSGLESQDTDGRTRRQECPRRPGIIGKAFNW